MRSSLHNSQWAVYRSHGDPFPVSPSWLSQCVADAGLAVPQRGEWLAKSLNTLALHSTNSDFDKKLQGISPNAVQQALASRVVHALEEAGEPPHDMDGTSVMRDMGISNDLYSEEPANLAGYSFDKVKVLHSQLNPRPLEHVLPAHSRALLSRATTFIEKSCGDVARSEPCDVVPYWDPKLRHNHQELTKLLVRLANQGLVSFRTAIKERIGIFFVRKKTPEWIRMVIDARRVNHLHKEPPNTRLATPRSYLDLQLPPQHTSETCGYGIEADVNDCFYNFTIEPCASFFGVDLPMQVQEWQALGWKLQPIFSDETSSFFVPSQDLIVYPVFRGLCMGWSWALFFAQQAVAHIACGQVQRPLREVRDKLPLPDISEGPIVGVYVDNISILGIHKEEVSTAAKNVDAYFKDCNIPLTWTSETPTDVFTTVGIVVDFRSRCIRNKPARLWKAFFAGREILKRGRVSVKLLEKWLGYMTSLFMLAPCGLSCFFHIYRFIAENRDRRAYMWNSVRHEIRLSLGIMWLARSQIDFDPIRQVDVGDSSDTAYAMLTTWAKPSEIASVVRWRESWRFNSLPSVVAECAAKGNREELIALLDHLQSGEPHPSIPQELRAGFSWGAGLATQYANWLADSVQDASWLRTSAVRSQVRARRKARVEVDVPALVPPIPDDLCDRRRYSLLWRKKWRSTATHINVKESRVCLSSLKRAARCVSLHGKVKLTLTDNLAGLCALERGRSSAFQLNKVCRSSAAYQLASGIRWRLRHVETLRNPADDDSRFDKPKGFEKAAPLVHRGRRCDNRSAEHPEVLMGTPEQLLGAGHCGSASSSLCSPLKPKNTSKGLFLELFAGSCRLTHAIRQRGLAVADPVDILLGSHHDLRRRASQLAILSWIKSGWIKFVHLGTPCTVFSRARHCIRHLERALEKERVGLEFAWFSAEVIATCNRYNVNWSLENPRSSRLFEVPFLAQLLNESSYVDIDFCRFGEPYKKPTRIYSSAPFLELLGLKCNHKKHAVVLRGSERFVTDGKVKTQPRTVRAGAYPFRLVDVWAQLVEEFVSPFSRESHAICSQFAHELKSAAGFKGGTGTQQVQASAAYDSHFQQIQKAHGVPQKVIVFGQDSSQTAEAKRRNWERLQKKVGNSRINWCVD